MTMPRYFALKEYWQSVPPQNIMLKIIAESRGVKFKNASNDDQGDVFYDESYYRRKKNKSSAAVALAADFAAPGR
jgi:hypothetical protein